MSQVNFVEQFNLFMQYAQRNRLTSYERLFFIAIFHCANSLAKTAENYEWPDDYFPVSNTELTGWTGFDERAIRNTRNSLKEKGLLDFEKGDGKKRDPSYRIFYLRRIGYKIAPDGSIATYTGNKNAADRQETGSEFAAGREMTGSGFAPDRQETGRENAADDENTGSRFAPDTVGDSVGDNPVIGSGFAPDTVGDHFIKSKRKHTNVNTNANSGAAPASPLADPEFGKVMSYFLDKINPMPSGIAVEGLKYYTKAMCADVVIHAMQICQDERHVNWSYLRKILMRYEREGIRTMLDVQMDEERRDAAGGFKRRRGAQKEPAGGYGLVDMDGGQEPVAGLVTDYGRGW